MLICSRLSLAIEDIIDERGLTRAAAAEMFGVSQSRISEITGRKGSLTIDELVKMLAHAGFRVDVSVRPIAANERAAAQALEVPAEAEVERVSA